MAGAVLAGGEATAGGVDDASAPGSAPASRYTAVTPGVMKISSATETSASSSTSMAGRSALLEMLGSERDLVRRWRFHTQIECHRTQRNDVQCSVRTVERHRQPQSRHQQRVEDLQHHDWQANRNH